MYSEPPAYTFYYYWYYFFVEPILSTVFGKLAYLFLFIFLYSLGTILWRFSVKELC